MLPTAASATRSTRTGALWASHSTARQHLTLNLSTNSCSPTWPSRVAPSNSLTPPETGLQNVKKRMKPLIMTTIRRQGVTQGGVDGRDHATKTETVIEKETKIEWRGIIITMAITMASTTAAVTTIYKNVSISKALYAGCFLKSTVNALCYITKM